MVMTCGIMCGGDNERYHHPVGGFREWVPQRRVTLNTAHSVDAVFKSTGWETPVVPDAVRSCSIGNNLGNNRKQPRRQPEIVSECKEFPLISKYAWNTCQNCFRCRKVHT
jgi:hypothetical protein